MSAENIIINFSEAEAQLILAALRYWQVGLNKDASGSRAHSHAGRYVYQRCDLIVGRIEAALAAEGDKGAKG